jgi:hypothetical protein
MCCFWSSGFCSVGLVRFDVVSRVEDCAGGCSVTTVALLNCWMGIHLIHPQFQCFCR